MSNTNTPQPLVLNTREAAQLIGIGLTLLYREIAAGKIKARKIGSRTIIKRSDIEAYIESLPVKQPEEAA